MSLMRSNYSFTLVWTMVFIVFFAYFFVTASIVAFEDGFDETINQKGYPNDFREASKWEIDEYVRWATSWSGKYQTFIMQKLGFEKNDDDRAPSKENDEVKEKDK